MLNIPNKAYGKGYRFEKLLRDTWRRFLKCSFVVSEGRKNGHWECQTHEVQRTAGSHGWFDIIVVDIEHNKIKLIQAKDSHEKVNKPFTKDLFEVEFLVARKEKGKIIYE